MKCVQIRSFVCSVFFRIQSECEKIRTRKNSLFGHFSRSDKHRHIQETVKHTRISFWLRITYFCVDSKPIEKTESALHDQHLPGSLIMFRLVLSLSYFLFFCILSCLVVGLSLEIFWGMSVFLTDS